MEQSPKIDYGFCDEESSGFTLVELLVVLAIIGILTTLVSFSYIDALHRTDDAVCCDNLRTIYQALLAYRADYNHFPPADGLCDSRSRYETTGYGCGPAANGYWSGVSLLLVEKGYSSESSLYCPALRRSHPQRIESYSTCAGSAYSGKQIPQWRYLRYAFNSAAVDAGGVNGGEQNIETDQTSEVWLVRCLHLNVEQFDPARAIPFPNRMVKSTDAINEIWYGEFELTVLGNIRTREVVKARE